MGTGTAASSICPEDTRRSDSGGVLRRRGRSARSTGKSPYASQVVPSSRSPWCAAPRPGGAVPQAIGRLACALDTVHRFRDLRTARTALGSGHPPGRRAVRYPPRCNEALPSGRAPALAVSGGALLRLALPPRDVGVNGFVLPAVLPLVVFRQLRTAARRRAHAALGVRPVRSRQRANRRPTEPVVLHAVTSFPGGPFWRAWGRAPSYRVRTARNAGSFRRGPPVGRQAFMERYAAAVTSDERFGVRKMASRERRLVPTPPEPGLALLEEGPHAFALVIGPEQVQEQVAFHAHPVGAGRLGRGSDRMLGGRERLARSPRERPRVPDRLLEDRSGGVDHLRDTQPDRRRGIELHPRVHEVTRHPRPDQSRQSLGPAGARDHAERDLGLADPGVVREVAQVASERQLQPAAEREARDRGDRDLPDAFQQVADVTERLHARAHLVLAPAGHRLDVGPRREELRAAQDDEGADVGSLFRFADRFAELDPDPQIDRVRGRAIDADHADAIVDLETNELAHGGAAYPVSIVAAASRVSRSPSTSGVRETPNAKAASGASARDGSAKNDAVTASNGTPRSLVRISAAACPEAWVGVAPSPRSISAKPSALTRSESTRLNSSHLVISYAVFCLKKKKTKNTVYQKKNNTKKKRKSNKEKIT